jgi:2-polyprenyl-6-methoxyphenol hydroxylase-like FAD-dependent oxidoreductase
MLSGVWLTNLPNEIDHSVAYICNDIVRGAVVGLFPQRDDHARAYFGFHPSQCKRLQGDGDFNRFLDECNASTDGAISFTNVKPAGPLASFECVDVRVNHPYANGVALVGDAASSNDPSWGQGLSLALRDARVLSGELLRTPDWSSAGHRYAELHDQHYGKVRLVSGWFYDLFQRPGPEAEARRARALPLLAGDPTRAPDVLFSGPDFPLAADARARFFGEDVHAKAAAV